MIMKKIGLNDERHVTQQAYLYEKHGEMPYQAARPAVVVCPGGGYQGCSAREADPIAMYYSAAGYQTFVLRYSVGNNAEFPQPLTDLCKTMKLIRENAEEWGVRSDRIAVCGFSAGGHLAASLGVYWNDPEILEKSGCRAEEVRPNAMVLLYPVISSSWPSFDHGKIAHYIVGNNDYDTLYRKFNLMTAVREDTPITFLAHTGRDNAVPVEDSLKFASALVAHRVPCELHIFPNGCHGLATSDSLTNENGGDPDFAKWMPLSRAFLDRVFKNYEKETALMDQKATYRSTY